MAYYAFIKEGKVQRVIVAEAAFFVDKVETEPGEWIETFTDGTKKYFAGMGFNYDSSAEVFYAPQPFNSWTLNTITYKWESPVTYPNDGETYYWNEAITNWAEWDPED